MCLLRPLPPVCHTVQVRQFMSTSRADEVLVILLDHAPRDVVFAAAGALVNVGADHRCNGSMLEGGDENGCAKLVKLVRRAGLRDLPMAAVACKALFNVLAAQHAKGPAATPALERPLLRLLHESVEELVEASEDDDRDFQVRPLFLYH